MTFAQLKLLTRKFGQAMPNYDGSASPEELAGQLNVALRWLGRRLKAFEPSVVWNLAQNRSEYRLNLATDFGRRVLLPMKAIVGGNVLTDRLGEGRLVSQAELDYSRPDWRWAGEGRPTMASYAGHNRIRLDVPPSAAVVAEGRHFVEGIVAPGVMLADGTYLSEFPTTFQGSVSSSVDTDLRSPATVELAAWGDAGVSANLTGMSADGGTESRFGQSYPMVAEQAQTVVARNFQFDLGSGAVLDRIEFEKLEVRAGTSSALLQIAVVKDATGENTPVWTQTISLAGGGASTDVSSSLTAVTGLSTADIEAATFGVQFTVYPGTGEEDEPLAGVRDVYVDWLQLKATGVVPGMSGTVTDAEMQAAEPDLDDDLHDALAWLAAVIAAEPLASDQAVMARMQLMSARWVSALQEVAAQNSRAVSPVDGPVESQWADTVWGTR